MEAEAAEIRAAEAQLQSALDASRAELAEVVAHRQGLERSLAEAERAVVAAVRAVADRREGLAKLAGQVNALRTRALAGRDESARLSAAAADARQRAEQAEAELARVQAEVGLLDAGELGLDTKHENAVAAFEAVEARVRELAEAEREAERERSTWTARADALVVGLTRKDGTAALLAAGERLPGVLGSVAALLTVAPGHEAAVAAALGTLADAVAVAGLADAVQALEILKLDDGGRAGLLIGAPGRSRTQHGWPALPAGCVWALEVVQAPPALHASVATALDKVAVVARSRRGRRPRRRPSGRPRGHPGRRRARRALVGRRLVLGAQCDRDQRRGRRGPAEGRRGRRPPRPAARRAHRRPRAGRGPPGRGRGRAGGPARVGREALGGGRAAGRTGPGRALGRRRGGPHGRGSHEGRRRPRPRPRRPRRARGAAAPGRGILGRAERTGYRRARRLAGSGRRGPAGRDGGPPHRPHRRGAGAGDARPGRPAAAGGRDRADGPPQAAGGP